MGRQWPRSQHSIIAPPRLGKRKKLFTGHSYGAAMATLSAFYYCPAEVGEKKKALHGSFVWGGNGHALSILLLPRRGWGKEKSSSRVIRMGRQWPRSQHSTIAPPRLGKK